MLQIREDPNYFIFKKQHRNRKELLKQEVWDVLAEFTPHADSIPTKKNYILNELTKKNLNQLSLSIHSNDFQLNSSNFLLPNGGSN